MKTWVLGLFFCLIFAVSWADVELRAAIDIGSGTTKMKIAKVDTEAKKIIKVVYEDETIVSYQAQLALSSDQTFDPEIEALGIQVLQHDKAIADENGVKKIVTIATSAFRNAKNTPEFVADIKSATGLDVQIIDQELEGILAFNAVIANTTHPHDQIVVWDIGGGSLQFTTQDSGGYHVYQGTIGAIPFKNLVIQQIEGKDPKTTLSPNPMSQEQILAAISLAQSISHEVDNHIQTKITANDTMTVGVGSLFRHVIKGIVGHTLVTQEELSEKVLALQNKDDTNIGFPLFADTVLTNSTYVLGMMQGLNINPIHIQDINNADGALLYEPFW